MPRSRRAETNRRLQFEQFEQRLVMSGQAISPAIVQLLPEMELAAPAITGQDVVWQGAESLEDVAQRAAELAAQFGLDGAGQTIAVIDSGIAWDHHALGGGFGEGHQVVGGWDFAENDALPYDDGPAGYHGTHVAGIIGSQDDTYGGISRGADLVALRVFDDQGGGDLDAVEAALRWVHENQHQYRFPITTVNLSLGTGWDPETTPGWGQLEDELAQLEQDGIFISVAAGNGYRTLGRAGLSYPAVSSHVVPVASHGVNGSLSDFSQRDQGVLVAPGEMLRSTVPDHLFGGTRGDQLLASSGTSMAAPYLAGASALLRQANEFMGQSNIDQDLLYQQFKATADRLYDAATGMSFDRLNLAAALQSVITDFHASQAALATDLGVLEEGDRITGTIGQLGDIDAFRWTAAQTGRITLEVSATHNLAPLIEADSGWQREGNQIFREVRAGQTCQLRLATSAGTGHYELQVGYQETAPARNLGVVLSQHLDSQSIQGDQWYRMTAGRDGQLTVQAKLAGQDQLRLQVVDQDGQLLATQHSAHGLLRVDAQVRAGDSYWIRATSDGPSARFDLQLTNLVNLDQGRLSIHGTSQANQFQITQSDTLSTTIDGVEYQWDLATIRQVVLVGHGGEDQLRLQLDSLDDRVITRPTGLSVINDQLALHAWQISDLRVDGGGGWDTVTLQDSAGADAFHSAESGGIRWARMQGAGHHSVVQDFDVIVAEARQASDQATLVGSQRDDVFVSQGLRQVLRDGRSHVVVDGFSRVSAFGGGGQDLANLHGSGAGDHFQLAPREAHVTTSNGTVHLRGFARQNALGQGRDSVAMQDTIFADVVDHRDGVTTVSGSGYQLYARGMTDTQVISVGGQDLATIHDTAGHDRLWAGNGWARFELDGRSLELQQMETIGWIATAGGQDVAQLQGSDQADQMWTGDGQVRLRNADHQTVWVAGAETVSVNLLGGPDQAFLQGTAGRDRLTLRQSHAELQTPQQRVQIQNAQHVDFAGGPGRDSVRVEGPLDLLQGLGSQARLVHRQNTAHLRDIAFLQAQNVDQAMADYDLEQVDFTYLLQGNWQQR